MLQNYGRNEVTEMKIRIAVQKRAKHKVLHNVNFPVIKKLLKYPPKLFKTTCQMTETAVKECFCGLQSHIYVMSVLLPRSKLENR